MAEDLGAVDLTLYDVTPADLVDRALARAETQLPEAQLPTGSVELMLLEALSVPVSEIVFALNRLPLSLLEELLATGYRIARSPGVAGSASVTFTVGAAGGQIPVGTLVGVPVDEDLAQFVTDQELTVPAGTTTGTVTVTAVELSARANGVPAGTPVEVLSSTSGVVSAALGSVVSGGADPEDTAAYLSRGSLRLSRLTDTLLLPSHFELAAREDPGVGWAVAVDNYDPGIPGTAGGHVSVAVLDGTGGLLTGAEKDALATALQERAASMLGVHVIDPTLTAVDVTVSLVAAPGADPASVQAAAVEALEAYLSPLGWTGGAVVRRNELIALLDRVEGVEYVSTGHPVDPSGDVTLTGVAPLPLPGALQVTVV